MTNKLKYTCLIGSFVLAVSIIAGYKGKSKRIVCGIIGGNHKDYDNEIKKYCSGYGIKTSFLYGDDGNVIAATLKR